MAKHNGKKNMMRRNNGGISSLMLAFVSFVFGYLIATVFDTNQLSGWVSQHLSPQKMSQVAANTKSPPEIPKPKFEFYTLLTKEQPTSPAPVLPAKPGTVMPAQAQATPNPPLTSQQAKSAVTPIPAPIDLTVTQKLPLHEPLAASSQAEKAAVVATSTDRFMIQVASFRNLREAEKMKASLMMKGFDVSIAATVHQQVNWYRVVIGPFVSRTEAERARLAFARSEHIIGMIRKMDA